MVRAIKTTDAAVRIPTALPNKGTSAEGVVKTAQKTSKLIIHYDYLNGSVWTKQDKFGGYCERYDFAGGKYYDFENNKVYRLPPKYCIRVNQKPSGDFLLRMHKAYSETQSSWKKKCYEVRGQGQYFPQSTSRRLYNEKTGSSHRAPVAAPKQANVIAPPGGLVTSAAPAA